jgi:hypothetical protein
VVGSAVTSYRSAAKLPAQDSLAAGDRAQRIYQGDPLRAQRSRKLGMSLDYSVCQATHVEKVDERPVRAIFDHLPNRST